MRYNKLVRDRIPEIIRSKGDNPVTHTASDEEFEQKLKEKLKEEADEFFRDGQEEELADILEVVHAICGHKKIDIKKLENLRKKKAAERGAFQDKIILDEVK
jgi:predicted house-cleaning noncanonical NTP pyrophosphatase (MazG superfamily)